MPIQLDDAMFVNIHLIMAHTSKRLTVAHKAYQDGRLKPRHVANARDIRNSLAMMLAAFADGSAYGSLEPDMLQALRHMETTANAFLCSVHGVDDTRGMVA